MTQHNVLLVLVLLVSGYLFCINFHSLRWVIKRSGGYHTFLLSAAVGIAVFILTYITRLVIIAIGPDVSLVQKALTLGVPELVFSPSTLILLELTGGALLVSVLLPWSIYKCTNRFGVSKSRLFQGAFISAAGETNFRDRWL